MTITSANYSVRHVKIIGPGTSIIPHVAVVREADGADPLSPEVVTETQGANFDIHGSPIGPDSVLVHCLATRAPVNIYNAFQCQRCHGLFSTFVLAEEIPPEVAPAVVVAKAPLRRGICSACYAKGKWSRIIGSIGCRMGKLLKFIAGPFLPQPATATSFRNDTSGASSGSTKAISIALATLYFWGHVGIQTASAIPHSFPAIANGGLDMMIPSNQASNEGVSEIVQEAMRYGLDDVSRSPRGARLILNLRRGMHSGYISPHDITDLKGLLTRAKRCFLPMDWRVAYSQPPPPDIICQGDVQCYQLLDRTPVGLSFLDMTESIRCTGRVGSSKTTAAGAILAPAVKAGRSVFVIDSKGDGQMDFLCRNYPGRVLKVRVGRPNRPFFNPWQWARDIREYFLRIFSRHDSRIVLDAASEHGRAQIAINGAKELTHSHLMKNVIAGTTPSVFPCIPKDFFRSMFSVFYDIDCSPLRPQLLCQRGYDLKTIIRRGYGVIIDTSSIAGTLQEEFLICTLLTAVRAEITSDPVLRSRTGTQVIYFIDEATNLSAASKTPGNLPSLVHLATLVRSSSICLFCVYHSMSIVHPVLNAAGLWIVTQISDGNDIWTAKTTFTLNDQQARSLTDLPKGVAVMRMGNRYTSPFLIIYPKLPDSVKMTDAEIDANNGPILATLPDIVPENYRAIRVVATARTAPTKGTKSIPGASPAGSAVVAPMPSTVDNDHLAILRDVATNRFINVSARASSLRLPSGKRMSYTDLKAALDDLRNQGFLGEATIHLAPRAGAPSLMHFLTAEGHTAIGSLYKPLRGGYLHDFGQHLICHILAGHRVVGKVEMMLPGATKRVDVGFDCPTSHLPVAVELPVSTFADEPGQAERDLAAGWARVLVVCLNKADLANTEKAFAAAMPSPDSRTKLCLVSALTVLRPHEIYDSPDFVVKANVSRNQKGTAI